MLKMMRYRGLDSLPLSYANLFEEASQESFFLSLPWFRNFEERILEPEEKVLVYGAEESELNGHPMAALVLRCPSIGHYWNIFKIIQLESLSNYYSSFFGPLMSNVQKDKQETIEILAQAIFEDRRKWHLLNLKPLSVSSPDFERLLQAFRKLGLAVQTYFCFGNWYLDVQGRNYCEYFETLPSAIRKKIPYKKRKLEKKFSVSMKIITEVGDVDQAMSDYEEVYRASWKKAEPFPEFIRGLARETSLQGWLRLGVLYLDEKPVAAQLWVVQNKIASIYKLAYDKQFSNLSVGTILTAHLMQHVIDEDRVYQVDYLTGDDSYKRDWMSARRERWGMLIFNTRSFQGIIQGIKHIGGRGIKRTMTTLFSSPENSANI